MSTGANTWSFQNERSIEINRTQYNLFDPIFKLIHIIDMMFTQGKPNTCNIIVNMDDITNNDKKKHIDFNKLYKPHDSIENIWNN
jgi:hypothetical protein